MEAWIVEEFFRGKSGHERLYRGDRETIDELAAIESIDIHEKKDIRIRQATAGDLLREQKGEIRSISYGPDCRDWLLLRTFDGNRWPDVYRDRSVSEMLVLLRKEADGISLVFLRPATVQEIGEDDAIRAKDLQEFEEAERARLRSIARGRIIGTAVQILITPLIAYGALTIFEAHIVLGICLLGAAVLSGLNIAWWLLKLVIYQISFAAGKGFQDGTKRNP